MAYEGNGNGIRGVWEWLVRGMGMASEGYGNGL